MPDKPALAASTARGQAPPMFRIASLGAALVLACTLALGWISGSVPRGVRLQPSEASVPIAEFVLATNQHTAAVMRFFAVDTLLVLGYVILFLGLHAATAARAPICAGLGLAAGALMGSFDLVENAFYFSYALAAARGTPLTEPDLPLLHLITKESLRNNWHICS